LRQVFRKLPVRCLPENIPVKIEHDVTELGLGEHVSVQDLGLPEGVVVRYEPTRTIAAVVAPEKAPAEAEEAQPGAAAAPAAEAPAEAAPTTGT
jgi:large subunit ribosomal protein L25